MMGSSSGWHFPSPESADMVYDVYDSDDPRQGTGSLSRLSLCTSSMYEEDDDDDDDDEDGDDGVFDGTRMSISKLSLESCFNADDDEEQAPGGRKMVKGTGLDFDMIITSSDSDKDQPGGGGGGGGGGCYSLPGTPPGRRRRNGQVVGGAREYASENESYRRKQRRRRAGGGSGNSNKRSGGSGLVVITRPKGGQRSLCMDLEEVKACRDLGFELEHERMMEVPATNRLSFSGSTTLDTSSGGNSPIANWRISSPGDDPRDVKARLKVWAQAVAIASTSRHGGGF